MNPTYNSVSREMVSRSNRNACAAFSLLELLSVVIIVTVLVAVMLPMRQRPRRSNGVTCINNSKQLILAWQMYAHDNNDHLVNNRPIVGRLSGSLTNNWVGGVMDWSANPQNTNVDLILKASLGDYTGKQPSVFHCPADKSVSVAGPRVRSYSMNAFVGDNGSGAVASGWKQFLKLSDVGNQAGTFVFLDEHPNSINDGYFVNDPAKTNAWIDLPASYHNGAGGVSFADGHAEIHRWINPSTRQPIIPKGGKPHVIIPPAERDDITWLLQRTTTPSVVVEAPRQF